jgi:hypothetical protein
VKWLTREPHPPVESVGVPVEAVFFALRVNVVFVELLVEVVFVELEVVLVALVLPSDPSYRRVTLETFTSRYLRVEFVGGLSVRWMLSVEDPPREAVRAGIPRRCVGQTRWIDSVRVCGQPKGRQQYDYSCRDDFVPLVIP